MKKITLFIFGAIILIGVIAIATRNAPPAPEKDPQVAVTMYPLYDVVKTIAGDAVTTKLLVPAQVDPRTYTPSTLDRFSVNDTRVIYRIGFGLDDWSTTIADAKTDVLTLSADIAIRRDEGMQPNPYYFLTIGNAKQMATLAEKDLSSHFPAYRATFQANLVTYLAKLDAADTQIRETLARTSNPTIITTTNEWDYFAAAYGVTVTHGEGGSFALTSYGSEMSFIDLMVAAANSIANNTP